LQPRNRLRGAAGVPSFEGRTAGLRLVRTSAGPLFRCSERVWAYGQQRTSPSKGSGEFGRIYDLPCKANRLGEERAPARKARRS